MDRTLKMILVSGLFLLLFCVSMWVLGFEYAVLIALAGLQADNVLNKENNLKQ